MACKQICRACVPVQYPGGVEEKTIGNLMLPDQQCFFCRKPLNERKEWAYIDVDTHAPKGPRPRCLPFEGCKGTGALPDSQHGGMLYEVYCDCVAGADLNAADNAKVNS